MSKQRVDRVELRSAQRVPVGAAARLGVEYTVAARVRLFWFLAGGARLGLARQEGVDLGATDTR